MSRPPLQPTENLGAPPLQTPHKEPVHLRKVIERDGPLRRMYRQKIKPAIAIRAGRSVDATQTIVMTGSPRGGTSWLADMLAAEAEASLIWEPLDRDYSPELRALSRYWRNYIPPGESSPRWEQFLTRVLAGRIRNARINNHAKLTEIMRAKRFVVKFVRAQMLLHWMCTTLDFMKPGVLLLRHPCAVVSSQLRWGEWSSFVPPRFPNVRSEFPQFVEVLESTDTLEEQLAAMWAVETRVALSGPKPLPFLTVCYESLVRNGNDELERIFDSWGRSVPAESRRLLKLPSTTTTPDSHVATGRDRLAGWAERLSPDQKRRILRVVERLEVDFYGDDLEPDYARLSEHMAR